MESFKATLRTFGALHPCGVASVAIQESFEIASSEIKHEEHVRKGGPDLMELLASPAEPLSVVPAPYQGTEALPQEEEDDDDDDMYEDSSKECSDEDPGGESEYCHPGESDGSNLYSPVVTPVSNLHAIFLAGPSNASGKPRPPSRHCPPHTFSTPDVEKVPRTCLSRRRAHLHTLAPAGVETPAPCSRTPLPTLPLRPPRSCYVINEVCFLLSPLRWSALRILAFRSLSCTACMEGNPWWSCWFRIPSTLLSTSSIIWSVPAAPTNLSIM